MLPQLPGTICSLPFLPVSLACAKALRLLDSSDACANQLVVGANYSNSPNLTISLALWNNNLPDVSKAIGSPHLSTSTPVCASPSMK